MIWLYRIVFLPALALVLPYYLIRMWRRGGYGKGFRDRFGLIQVPKRESSDVKRIWIQAVSVGELLSIRPILEFFASQPKTEVVLTTTTSTGLNIALEIYPGLTTGIGVFPLDFWPFSNRAWNRIEPDAVLLTESELWPEHLHQARSRGATVILINARLSDRSYKSYKILPGPTTKFLSQVDRILASSRHDQDRFLEMGVDPEKITLAGNLKCDIQVETHLSVDQLRDLKENFGFLSDTEGAGEPLILLGASTWPGEERALLLTFENALELGIDCRLVLVPRHAERRKEIQSDLEEHDLSFHFRSENIKSLPGTMVYVADTTGELRSLVQAADLVFVGRSLPPHIEGQTPIEAAALGKPILFGPGMQSFHDISRSLVGCRGAVQVESPAELKVKAIHLLGSSEERQKMGNAAREWHAANQGAAQRTIDEVMRFLS